MTSTQHETDIGRARETRVVVGYSNKTGRGDLQPKSGTLPSVKRKASLPAEWGGAASAPGPQSYGSGDRRLWVKLDGFSARKNQGWANY